MKNIRFVIFFCSLLISTVCFSQTNGNNTDFETSINGGWVCKSGSYGTGPCPYPLQAGVCPSFNTVLNCAGCINPNGINAQLNTGDRQTIVDSNYYGTGIDPNSASPYFIHVVDSGGGNYSIRLGDAVTGGTNTTACFTGNCLGPGCFARAEGIRLTFNVTAQNALFTYHYSAFLQNGGHLPEEQPRFEVLMTLPNSNDTLIPGGHLIIAANYSNPACQVTVPSFHINGAWLYTNWTGVTTDLTTYIGQDIAVEFRTSDEFEGPASTTIINGVCTTTIDHGVTCFTGLSLTQCPDSGTCIGTFTCTYQPGSHSAYAYINVSGFPFFDGINELSNNAVIRIYPNPMTSSSIIEIIGTKSSEVVIYDMLGKELLRRKLIANKTEIQKGDLERGVYFVRANEYVRKLIVE